LINEKGQAVGVVSWQLRSGQNLNFAVPISYALGLDMTLPTQPLDSVKSVWPLPLGAESDSFGPALVKAYAAAHDARNSLMLDSERTTADNGFKLGVGSTVFAAETILRGHLQQLETISSSDSEKDALRKDLAAVIASMLQSIDYYLKAVREARVAGGWSPSADELMSRSEGALAARDSTVNEIWTRLSAEYSSFLPPGLRDHSQDDRTTLLGVSTWSGDSLVLAYVFPDGLAAILGLKSGDKILSAGDTTPKNLAEFKQQLRRAAGSQLRIRIRKPDGSENELEASLPPDDWAQYRITGSGGVREVKLTWTEKDGRVRRADVTVPQYVAVGMVPKGARLSISAQHKHESGCVSVAIWVGHVELRRDERCGANAVATVNRN
jgi:hypothetical protein